jgi:hypothetical protein
MKKTVTPRQLAANRANAKKSTGPKTRQGKLRSAYNSLNHGLCAVTVVLPGENAERYDYLRQEYMDHIRPATAIETQLADLFIADQWRRERGVRYETALALEGRAFWDRDIKKQYPGISEAVVDGLIFGRRANAKNDRTLQQLDRYERRLTSNSVRTWRLLKEIQNSRPPVDPAAPDTNSGPPSPMEPWPHPLPERVAPPEPAPEPVQPTENKAQETHSQKALNEPIPESEQQPRAATRHSPLVTRHLPATRHSSLATVRSAKTPICGPSRRPRPCPVPPRSASKHVQSIRIKRPYERINGRRQAGRTLVTHLQVVL